MLYPQEDRERMELYFACRSWSYSEPPSTTCVYRNELSNSVGDTAGITQDIGQDPTVRSDFCPDICTVCGQEIICVRCNKPAHVLGCWLEVADQDVETVVDEVIPFRQSELTPNGTQPAYNIDLAALAAEYEELTDPCSDEDYGEEFYIPQESQIADQLQRIALTSFSDQARGHEQSPRLQSGSNQRAGNQNTG